MDSIPYGYCHCGCGQRTPIATHTRSRRGHVDGQPLPYLPFHQIRAQDRDRLWSRIRRGPGCHEWQGTRDRTGYGKVRYNGKDWRVHRLIWVLANGPILADQFVCHHCDNPTCCRLDHLFLGTAAENSADMVRKGRAAHGHNGVYVSGDDHFMRKHPERALRGEQNKNSHLSPDQVREIRRRHAEGADFDTLAREFPCSRSHAHRIVRREVWAHLP